MHAVISLLDEQHILAVKDLWAELERDFGIRMLAQRVPYPHFSYQIAQHYEEQQLLARIEDLARRTAPFSVSARDLSQFPGAHPVIFVPVLLTSELSQFHEIVLQYISPAGTGISPYYEPDSWVPHITLAEHDTQADTFASLLAWINERHLAWTIIIDNLAIVWDTGTSQELRYRFPLQGR